MKNLIKSTGLAVSALSCFAAFLPNTALAFTSSTHLNGVDFAWSSAGAIAGMHCTAINEGAEPAHTTWGDNYFCSSQDIGMRWHSAGPIAGMKCTQTVEYSDPHTWTDNYLCLPNNSSFAFEWHSAGAHSTHYVQWLEASDPDTWHDNFLSIGVAGDPMILMKNLIAPYGSHYSNVFSSVEGVMAVDIFIDNPGTPHNSEIAKAHGVIHSNNIQGDSYLADALRGVLALGSELGMPQPTPFSITLNRQANGNLDLAFKIRVLDTWREINLDNSIGTQAKFKSLDLIFHAVGGKGKTSYPVDAIGQAFIKPTSDDSWLAVRPKITVTKIANGSKVTLGGVMVGSCHGEPSSGTDLNSCNNQWDLFNRDIVEADSVAKAGGNRVGDLFVTYTNGKYSGVKGSLEQGRIKGMGKLASFAGEAKVDLNDISSWYVSGSSNYANTSFNVTGSVNNSGGFYISGSRSINTGVAQGTNTLILGNHEFGVKFSGKLCASYVTQSCRTVCDWIPFIGSLCKQVCDSVNAVSCSPSFESQVGSDNKVCAHVPHVGSVCTPVL